MGKTSVFEDADQGVFFLGEGDALAG